MDRRVLRFKDDKSDKFWWIAYSDADLVVNYGKSGTWGKYQIKEFESAEACVKEASKLIAQKLKKGYCDDPDFDFDAHYYFDDEEIGPHVKTSHPNFSSHFTDDCYYDCGDEEAPFGSDEGSDTLAELGETLRKKKSLNLGAFPRYLIETVWEMSYIPSGCDDEETVRTLLQQDEMNLIQSDMVTYATAFGQIKITGRVDKALKESALAAMRRMQTAAKLRGWAHSETLDLMISDLASFNHYSD